MQLSEGCWGLSVTGETNVFLSLHWPRMGELEERSVAGFISDSPVSKLRQNE